MLSRTIKVGVLSVYGAYFLNDGPYGKLISNQCQPGLDAHKNIAIFGRKKGDQVTGRLPPPAAVHVHAPLPGEGSAPVFGLLRRHPLPLVRRLWPPSPTTSGGAGGGHLRKIDKKYTKKTSQPDKN